MAKKTYKNINTIFEKAKRGDLADTVVRPRLFSEFQYNKKAELVKPYLHYIDEKALYRSVDKFISQDISHKDVQELAKKYNKKLISPDTLIREMQHIWHKFPKEVVNDMFNVYYNDIQKLKFEDRSIKNKFRYQMLEKASNPVTKVLTRESNIKSMIFTRGMIQYYLSMMAMLQQEDVQAFEEMMKQMKGEGDDDKQQKGNGKSEGTGNSSDNNSQNNDSDQDQENNSGNNEQSQNSSSNSKSGKEDNKSKSVEQQLKDLTKRFENSDVGKQILDKIMKDATQTAQSMDTVMTKEELDQLWKDLSSNDHKQSHKAFTKVDKNYLTKIENELKKVSMSMNGVKNKIKTLLDKSISYFSAKEIPYFENIFEADSLGGLQDYELLHPKLRKLMMEDLNVKEIKRLGKIDIYLDMSGSMSSSCGISGISKETFAKAFAYKMKELNLLNNVYSFQNSVKFEGNSMFDILTISGGGGTNINNVVSNIEKNRKNAIVLTDAEDNCEYYSELAYFIGVNGARFNYFNSKTLSRYYEGNQMIIFDGNKTYGVGRDGHKMK